MSKFMSILILVIICLFLIMTTQLRAGNSLTFFADRAGCSTACPNLPVEDFENSNCSATDIEALPAPLDENSNDACFTPGQILPGIQFLNDGPERGGIELAFIGSNTGFGNPSDVVVANFFIDGFKIINFPSNDVNTVCMDLTSFLGSGNCNIDIFGPSGLLGSTVSPCTAAGNFFGVKSNSDIITMIVISDPLPDPGAEGADNIAFGSCIVDVDKDYRHTAVCFEKDNDGDGLFSEDPVDSIDNDGDGLIDEDPDDCPGGTNLGTQLPNDDPDPTDEVPGNYVVQAILKKNGKVSSYNPGQYFAVSTVEVLQDLDKLTVWESYGDCTDPAVSPPLSKLNPPTGGGSVLIVEVGPDGVAKQIADAKSPNVMISDDNMNGIPDDAHAELENVAAGTTILMYVKFGPGFVGQPVPADNICENENQADADIDGNITSGSASATLKVQ